MNIRQCSGKLRFCFHNLYHANFINRGAESGYCNFFGAEERANLVKITNQEGSFSELRDIVLNNF